MEKWEKDIKRMAKGGNKQSHETVRPGGGREREANNEL